MNWTTTPPTEPGWYWARWDRSDMDDLEIVRVRMDCLDTHLIVLDTGEEDELELAACSHWLGPLPEPVFPTDYAMPGELLYHLMT